MPALLLVFAPSIRNIIRLPAIIYKKALSLYTTILTLCTSNITLLKCLNIYPSNDKQQCQQGESTAASVTIDVNAQDKNGDTALH